MSPDSPNPSPEAVARAREHAAGYAYRVGLMLMDAAKAAFEAQLYAHEFPVAFNLGPAVKKAREAADLAVQWQGEISFAALLATPGQMAEEFERRVQDTFVTVERDRVVLLWNDDWDSSVSIDRALFMAIYEAAAYLKWTLDLQR
jgi:hypothetical protein